MYMGEELGGGWRCLQLIRVTNRQPLLNILVSHIIHKVRLLCTQPFRAGAAQSEASM